MAKIRITLIRNDTISSKPTRLIQRNIYKTLCKKIFVDSDNDSKHWTKDQWDDPHKVYELEDTLEKCEVAYNQFVKMKFETWHDLKTKIKESKGFRILPRKIRNFLINPVENESKYYDRFIQFLTVIGIVFDIELIK